MPFKRYTLGVVLTGKLIMCFKNTAERFGILTKFLHWSIAILFFVEYFLVYRREYFPKDSPEKLQYILLHKSFGVLILMLALLFIVWGHVGTRPVYASANKLEKIIAKSVHSLLYLVMLVQPLTGILMGLVGGRDIHFFNIFTISQFAQKNEALGNILYELHVWDSYLIIGLVSLHIFAALYHHFIRKDDILKRMTW